MICVIHLKIDWYEKDKDRAGGTFEKAINSGSSKRRRMTLPLLRAHAGAGSYCFHQNLPVRTRVDSLAIRS